MHLNWTPSMDDGRLDSLPGPRPGLWAPFSALNFPRGLYVGTQAHFVLRGIPHFLGHPVEPKHLIASGVSRPRSTCAFVQFAGLTNPTSVPYNTGVRQCSRDGEVLEWLNRAAC